MLRSGAMAKATPTTLPVGSIRAEPESPGRRWAEARKYTLAHGLVVVVDVGAPGLDLAGDLVGGDAQVAAARVAVDAAPVALVGLTHRQGGAVQARDLEQGRVAVGVEGDDGGPRPGAVRSHDLDRLVAGDHVGVGDDEVACRPRTRFPPGGGRRPPPRSAPSTGPPARRSSSGMPVRRGGLPRSGDGRSTSKTLGKRSSPMNSSRVAKVSGGSGRTALSARATDELRACSAGQPGRGRPAASATAERGRPARRPSRRRPCPPCGRLPSGIATRSRPPTTRPRAWPRKPPAMRRAMTARNVCVSLADSNWSRTEGRVRPAT